MDSFVFKKRFVKCISKKNDLYNIPVIKTIINIQIHIVIQITSCKNH